MCTVPLLNRICRESYSDPEAVCQTLKERGMDLLTLTDHDSIQASEAFRSRHDFFMSEEVSCTTPTGTLIHIGVYGIEECHHIELQRRRADVVSLVEYLHGHNLFFSINHVFSALTGPRTDHDFALFERHFPAIEVLNGQISASCNRAAAQLARRWNKIAVGGSDSHTLTSLGIAYTEIPRARNPVEFLAALRGGHGRIRGVSGNYWKLNRAILEIGVAMVRERPATAALSPLLAAIPVVTLGNLFREILFARKWVNRLRVSRHAQAYEYA